MLDIAYLRENLEIARERLAHRGYVLNVETFQQLDGERKRLIQEWETLGQKRNAGSAEIAKLKREKGDISAKQAEMTSISDQMKETEVQKKAADDRLLEMVAVMLNLVDPSVPLGMTEDEMSKFGVLANPRSLTLLQKPIGIWGRRLGFSTWNGAAR